MLLRGDLQQYILLSYTLKPEILHEDDGSITVALDQIYIAVNGPTLEKAMEELLSEIKIYANDYRDNMNLFINAPNRKDHFPYMLRVWLCNNDHEIKTRARHGDGERPLKNNLKHFIKELQAYQSTNNVFNPWRDYDQVYDICPAAPDIRLKQIQQFLYPRIPGAKYLLVAEAVGYQGGRFTGVALTSERIILGHHGSIKPDAIFQNEPGVRTSNPNNDQLKNTQRRWGFTEPTATIVWGEVMNRNVSPYRVITWNIFPFHPFKPDKGPLTNRTPTNAELEVGAYYTKMLLKLCPGMTVVSIGGHSARTLSKLGIQNIHVPHPANGGAGKFKAVFKNII